MFDSILIFVVAAGLSRTDAQLDGVPKERQGVVRFIRSIRKYYTINTGKTSSQLFFVKDSFEKNLLKLYKKYTTPDNTGDVEEGGNQGLLNPTNLLQMMIDINTKQLQRGVFVDGVSANDLPNMEDAIFVINTIDLDGDQEVDTAEFIAWINAGASKTNQEMKQLASKSRLHERLIVFLRNLKIECTWWWWWCTLTC